MTPIPVTLLTGFLGSGKSTLLGRILRDPRFHDTAVVINEFGEVGIDHDPVWLDAWPSEDRRTRLVFITRNIPKETIQTFFKAWQSLGDGRATSAPGLQRVP